MDKTCIIDFSLKLAGFFEMRNDKSLFFHYGLIDNYLYKGFEHHKFKLPESQNSLLPCFRFFSMNHRWIIGAVALFWKV